MKQSLLLCAIFTLITSMLNAQVGIDTTNPQAQLDIRSSNQATPANTDGILIPKADIFPTTNPTAAQDGMLIFITGNGAPTKGFYYWDQSIPNWVAFAGASGANTLDQAYDEGGLGNGRIINATDGAVLINGEDGFLITGTFGSGDTPEITGAGTRMFFNPNKAAFRSGSVFNTQWDDINIGDYSTAMGNSTVASGESSTALGEGSIASGNSALATGIGSLASGDYSFSTGFGTTASGENAFAAGFGSNATGESSFSGGVVTNAPSFGETALGLYNTIYTPNSTNSWDIADRLFSIGNGTGAGSESNALLIYKSGEMVINDSYSLPILDGTANQVMQTDGLGNVTWANNSGTITVENGLTETTSVVRLGGALNQTTSIDHGTFDLNFNLSNSGDFNVQDDGTTHFQVRDNGNSYFGGEAIVTTNNDINGNTIARLFNIFNDEGALYLYRNGTPQHILDAGFTTVFNDQGIDVDFRIESDDNPNMFFLNANTNRIGFGTTTPTADLEIQNNTTHARITLDGNAAGSTTEVIYQENGLFEGAMGFQHTDDYLFMYHGHGTNQNGVMVQDGDLAVGLSGGELFRANGRIQSRGNVIPYFNNFYDLGNATYRWDDVYATNGIINTSDRRDKENIRDLNYGLETILKLKPVTFQWKDSFQKQTKIGFIAQDLLELLPEVVKTHDFKINTTGNKDGSIKEEKALFELERLGVYYSDIIPVLTKAIQEQQKIIELQNEKLKRLDKIEKDLEDLKKRFAKN